MKETRRQKKCIVGRLGRILSCAILAMAPFSAFAQMTDESPMCPECFSRRTNPPGIGWVFRIKELLTTKSENNEQKNIR